MLSSAELASVKQWHFDRATYHELGRSGAFEGRNVQLIDGIIIDLSPMGTRHADAVRLLTRFLVKSTPDDIDVMVQLPLAAAPDSEPEPDFALLRHVRRTAADDHPATALLIIEVADSSKRLDLGSKARLYARCLVPEYWVIDLHARATVVHRTPRQGRYASKRTALWTATVASSALPGLTVRLADVLER